MLRCVAVCCSVIRILDSFLIQGVAVCCSVLQFVAVRCSALQCVTVCCGVLQYVAVCCSVIRILDSVCSSVLQYIAVRCSTMQHATHTKQFTTLHTLQHAAPHRNYSSDGMTFGLMQQTATRYNTLQLFFRRNDLRTLSTPAQVTCS